MKRDKSKELYEKAVTLIPGGVNSPVRAFGAVWNGVSDIYEIRKWIKNYRHRW
jgi:glutamate-1-semialdehyde aminotransferase